MWQKVQNKVFCLSIYTKILDVNELHYLSPYLSIYLQQGNPSYCVSMFIRQACFVGGSPTRQEFTLTHWMQLLELCLAGKNLWWMQEV